MRYYNPVTFTQGTRLEIIIKKIYLLLYSQEILFIISYINMM